jgi:hypothetical protein
LRVDGQNPNLATAKSDEGLGSESPLPPSAIIDACACKTQLSGMSTVAEIEAVPAKLTSEELVSVARAF